jgi:hypothetical protein
MLNHLPGFFQEYINGTPPNWLLPPNGDLNAGAWRFRVVDASGAPVAIKVLGNDSDELRVNVGLALGLEYTSPLAEYVNMLNYKQLIHGRMFVLGAVPFVGSGTGPCAVLMQEIFYGSNLSLDSVPSMNGLLNVAARLAGQANRFAPDIVTQFGGRLFDDDDESDGVLLMC